MGDSEGRGPNQPPAGPSLWAMFLLGILVALLMAAWIGGQIRWGG